MYTVSLEKIDIAYHTASRNIFEENSPLFRKNKQEFDKQVLAAADSELEKLAD